MPYGVIYIAHNPRDGDNIFKVGKTERLVEDRMSELTSSTSNLGTYTALAYFAVSDIDSAEGACHKALHRYRVQANREFFEVPFSRLLRVVSEQAEKYAARSFVPDIQKNDDEAAPQSATDLLKSARARRKEMDLKWERAFEAANETIRNWFELIQTRAKAAAEEMKEELNLRWEIPESIVTPPSWKRRGLLCGVTVVAGFKKAPMVLNRRGLRGGNWGSLDLSAAVGEPKSRAFTDGEFVEWAELDDGRIGRVELFAEIANDSPSAKEKGETPVPKAVVSASAIRYDGYHSRFDQKGSRRKTYSDPGEAFEVFLAVAVENVKTPQFDVREKDSSRNGISDRGQFDTELLKY